MTLRELFYNIYKLITDCVSQLVEFEGKCSSTGLGHSHFLYVADPDFLNTLSGQVLAKCLGKHAVFKLHREPMFGNGLVMVEGDDWVRYYHEV